MATPLWRTLGAVWLAAGGGPALAASSEIPVPDAPGVSMMLIPLPAGVDPETAVPRAIDATAASQGGIGPRSAPARTTVDGTTMRIDTVTYNKAPGHAFLFLTVPGANGICMAVTPLNQAGPSASAIQRACLGAVGKGGGGGAEAVAPAPSASRSRPAAPIAAGTPARYAGNWRKVEGVYFRATTSMGVGGMIIQEFRPLVLFQDGTYYRVDSAALEDLDLAAERASRPERWGRWQKSAAGYTLIGDRGGRADAGPLALQQGQFFKAFPAEAGGGRLAKTYSRLSGTGNTAIGGTAMSAVRTRIAFAPDGTFGSDIGGGASDAGAAVTTSVRGSGGGQYRISNHTITMTQPDGSTKRQFFAFGSRKTPAIPDADMMFIGSSVYTATR